MSKRDVSRMDGRNHEDEIRVQAEDAGDETVGRFGRFPKIDLIGQLDFSTDSLAPMVVGAGASSLATLLIRKFIKNTTVKKFAPVVGGFAGAFACVPLKWWLGSKAMYRGMLTSVLVGSGQQTYELLRDHTKTFSTVGLLVPERVAGLVMETVGSDFPMLPAGNSMMPAAARASVDVRAYGKV